MDYSFFLLIKFHHSGYDLPSLLFELRPIGRAGGFHNYRRRAYGAFIAKGSN
jgi:hypothetical protein